MSTRFQLINSAHDVPETVRRTVSICQSCLPTFILVPDACTVARNYFTLQVFLLRCLLALLVDKDTTRGIRTTLTR